MCNDFDHSVDAFLGSWDKGVPKLKKQCISLLKMFSSKLLFCTGMDHCMQGPFFKNFGKMGCTCGHSVTLFIFCVDPAHLQKFAINCSSNFMRGLKNLMYARSENSVNCLMKKCIMSTIGCSSGFSFCCW